MQNSYEETNSLLHAEETTFYRRIVDQLIQDSESYESFVTNVFNRSHWSDWICVAAICHNWNVPISIVTPAWAAIVPMSHECDDM